MGAVALVSYAVFLVLAFGVRSVIQLRRTGRSGWVPSPGGAAAVGDGLFAIGVGGLVVGALLDVAGVVTRPAGGPVSEAAGLALVLSGALVALVAQAQMGSSWKAGVEPDAVPRLVTVGLFSKVRNPFYAGVVVASTGLVAVSPTPMTLVSLAALVAGVGVDVRLVEEPYLAETLGEAFTCYAARTGRYFPRLRRPG